MPVRSLLTNIPIRRPWQMIVNDILEVLVEQQVSSGYAELLHQMGRCQTTPRPDSHKNHSRTCPAVLCIRVPEIVHSDQGRNFESSIVHSSLPHHTLSPWTCRVMEWLRGLTAYCCRFCEPMWRHRKIGNNIYHSLCMHTELPANVRKASPAKYHYPCWRI